MLLSNTVLTYMRSAIAALLGAQNQPCILVYGGSEYRQTPNQFQKVIALEHPEFNCVQIDLEPRSPENEAQALMNESGRRLQTNRLLSGSISAMSPD